MQHLGLKLPLEMKHVYDRLDSDTREKFEGSKKAIMEALDEDPGETTNLYFDYPKIVEELKMQLDCAVNSGRTRPYQ